VNGPPADGPGQPAAGRPREVADVRRQERYGLLLGAIVVAFAVQGIGSTNQTEQVIVSALLGATLLLSLWCAEAKPIVMRGGALVVVAVFLASLLETVLGTPGGGATRLANALLVSLAPPAIIVGVVRSLRARQGVTLEAVFGVLCVYLLIGMLFAQVFRLIAQRVPGAFLVHGAPLDYDTIVPLFRYYSFVTLTTLGFGDLSPVHPLARSMTVLEALIGVLYPAVLIARLVSLERPEPHPAE